MKAEDQKTGPILRAIVALGANEGDRAETLKKALASLAELPQTRLASASSVIETDPVDVPPEFASMKFLNQVAVFETGLSPEDFSVRMHAIEDALGRVRTVKNGPRTIDLDLIDFGGLVRDTPELILPHPRAKERDFVMRPLAELGVTLDWTLSDVRRELAAGNRVLLLVRHAERPKIGYEDKTFGGSLPLTPAGEEMSVAYGRLLAGSSEAVQFRASPLLRTVMTAERIAEGMGLASAEIVQDAKIGNGSAFVDSELEVWELFRDGGFFTKMCEWMRRGVQRGFHELGSACDLFEDYVLSTFTGRLGVYTSHDVYIAAYLHGRGVRTDFCETNWPRFLDAAAIILTPDGRRQYALVRAGLSDRCCGV